MRSTGSAGRSARRGHNGNGQMWAKAAGPVEPLERRCLLSASIVQPTHDLNMGMGQSTTLDLNDFYSNPGVDNNTVFFNTSVDAVSATTGEPTSVIPVELTPSITPLTVANFLSYVDSGAYNGTFVHRLVPGFVWQAGGYTYDDTNGPVAIATNAPVKNEYSQPNVAGSIAMALVGSDPNSATDQFFFNLADNSQNLDNQDGGFTVFGHVITADGLAVMNQIGNEQVMDESGGDSSSPFTDVPVVGDTSEGLSSQNLVFINSITHGFSAQSSNTSVATVSVNDSNLTITPVAVGSTTITTAAEGLDGQVVTQQFTLSVQDSVQTTLGAKGVKSLRFAAGDNLVGTMTFSGPGSASVQFGGNGLSKNKTGSIVSGTDVSPVQITLSKTTAATHLTFRLNGPGSIAVGNITGGDLGVLNAPVAVVNGQITLTGAAQSISLADLMPGASLTATSINRLEADNLVGDVTTSGRVNDVIVPGGVGGYVRATNINLMEAGYFQGNQTFLSGSGISLKTLRSKYAVNSEFVTQGSINAVDFTQGISTSEILAGLSEADASSSTAATTAAGTKTSINSLVLGRGPVLDAFAGSTVAAGTLRRVSTGNLDDAASSASLYGFAATKIVSFHGYLVQTPVTLMNVTSEAQISSVLSKKKVTLTNLQLDIV